MGRYGSFGGSFSAVSTHLIAILFSAYFEIYKICTYLYHFKLQLATTTNLTNAGISTVSVSEFSV